MIKKKIFLFLTIIAAALCIVGCVDNANTVVRLSFSKSEYEVRMHEELTLKPTVNVSANQSASDVELVYESQDETIAQYVDGVVIPVSMGITKIKAYYKNDENVFATTTVTVIKAKIATLEIEDQIQLSNGTKQQISYKLVNNYSDAKVTFSAEENEVLTVTEEGLVETKSAGEATIKVTVSDAEESYEKEIKVVVTECNFTITYDTNGGELPEGAIEGYNSLELPTVLPVPTKEGYVFTGWLLDEDVVKELPAGTYGDVSLKACWEATSYKIKYSDKVTGNPTTYTIEDEVVLKDASKTGYTFKGWTLNGEKVTKISKGTTGELNLVATFEVITYTITYSDVVEGNPTTYTIEDEVVLANPSKENYDFKGWTLNGKVVTKIAKGTTGNLELVAKFEKAVNAVTLVLNGGNFTYKDLAAVKAAFNTDYVNLTGQTNYSRWKHMAALGNVFTNSNHKWDWLLDYWAGVNTNSYGTTTNASVFLQMKENGTCGDYYYFGVEITSWYEGNQQSVYSGGLKSANYADYLIQDAWWSYFSEYENNVLEFETECVLPTQIYNSETLSFVGWYTNPEFTGDPVTVVNKPTTVYAKWEETIVVDSITINNEISKLNKFATHQLEWTINPSDAFIKSVQITSSNSSVATITDAGLITAVANGTTTITITSKSSSGASASFELEVVTPDYFDAEYETNSYVAVDEEIKLLAQYVSGSTKKDVLWKSLTPEFASVNSEGVVTGEAEGLAIIRAYVEGNEDAYLDFYVTVLSQEVSEAIQLVLDNHESNVFVKYDLPIGYPTSNQGYYKDIFGSVSNIFYNHELEIDESMLEAGNATGSYYTNSVKNEGLQFITVHYTGTFGTGADTDNIATNFTKSGTSVSIHYVTGNHGVNSSGEETAEVFHTLSHDHGAYHAGDSRSRYYSNSTLTNASGEKIFTWMPTGVKYDGCDLLDVVFTASQDFYYEINGQKTKIKLPSTWNYDGRNSDHIYDTSTGLISSQSDFLSKFTWGTTFKDRTPESFFNSQDFPITVIDGYYYMGPTWWCFDQVLEGRICGTGGNRNSIGIESCVNEGSDVWYTWQVTAQLVAKLMYDNNLGIERVKGHHFFSGKDCPQPLLENDMEIWYKFIDMVQAEYELISTYKDYEFTFTSNNTDIISNNGRVISNPDDAVSTTYTVTIKVGDKTETITLASMVPSVYQK